MPWISHRALCCNFTFLFSSLLVRLFLRITETDQTWNTLENGTICFIRFEKDAICESWNWWNVSLDLKFLVRTHINTSTAHHNKSVNAWHETMLNNYLKLNLTEYEKCCDSGMKAKKPSRAARVLYEMRLLWLIYSCESSSWVESIRLQTPSRCVQTVEWMTTFMCHFVAPGAIM